MGDQVDHGSKEHRQRLDPKKTMRACGCTQYKPSDYKMTEAEDKVCWSGMGKAGRILYSISGRGKKVVLTVKDWSQE